MRTRFLWGPNYYLCSPGHHIISNQVQITLIHMIHRMELTFIPHILLFETSNEHETWVIWRRDFVTLWLMQKSGKFVKYSMCIELVWIRSDGDRDDITKFPHTLVKLVTQSCAISTHYRYYHTHFFSNFKSVGWQLDFPTYHFLN